MNDRRLDVMKGFSETTPPPEDAATAAARRARIAARGASVIRAEADARSARTKRLRVLGALSVAATVALAAGLTWRLAPSRGVAESAPPSVGHVAAASGAVVVTHEGTPRAVPTASDVALAGDDEVSTTPDAHARVVLASGATVEVAAGSRVRVQKSAPKNERVALAAGEVDVHVPKLAAGESFGIATPDALVTVHGTSFVVTVRDGGSHVKVREGLVSVLAAGVETFVHPGEEWPTAPSDSPPTTTAPAPTLSSSSKAPPPVAPRSSAGHVDASTLAEQNRLLQSALDARRKGEEARAVEQLSMLLARYPRSPLAQEARVEKFRALEKMGRHEKAVAEAKRYLVEFPAGFAAEEAKSLVSR